MGVEYFASKPLQCIWSLGKRSHFSPDDGFISLNQPLSWGKHTLSHKEWGLRPGGVGQAVGRTHRGDSSGTWRGPVGGWAPAAALAVAACAAEGPALSSCIFAAWRQQP